jgi:hypothetical protein
MGRESEKDLKCLEGRCGLKGKRRVWRGIQRPGL